MSARTLLLSLLLPFASLFAQVNIVFDQTQLVAQRGQEIEVVVRFQAPVPHGLLAYHLRLHHPAGTVDHAQTVVEIFPDLDFGFLTPPAIRSIDADGAEARGFVDLDAPAYTGTDFLVFRLTIAADAPFGAHPLTLSIPLAESFIHGDGLPFDDQIVLGTATLNIIPFIDLNANNVPDDWELDFYPALEDVPPSVTIQGVELTIREMYVAGLDPTGVIVPKFDTPTTFSTVLGRVYDVYHNPDLTDELGWVLVDTHDGTGTPYEITDPLQGFYRFEVRLPEEE